MTEAEFPHEPDDAAGETPIPAPDEAAAEMPTPELEPGGPPPFPVPAEVADLSPEELSPALAAVCFALNRPLTLAEAAAILGRSHDAVAAAADYLAGWLRGSGFMLQRHQEELQLVTRPEVAWAVQRALNPEKPGRLSRAALETLAIVAYRQPLTRAGIEAIRGVNCEAVLDSLERRGLIAEVGRQDSPGHPRLFGTTLRFLQVVGLERIEDLPPLPEGLAVPELPAADWESEPAAQEGTVEVRGEPVEPVEPPSAPDQPTGEPTTPIVERDTGSGSNGDSLNLVGFGDFADPDEGYDAEQDDPDDPHGAGDDPSANPGGPPWPS